MYPRLDSAVWTAPDAPPVDHVLGFDPEYGLVALVDRKGQPRRIDLRASEVRLASKAKLTSLASANGSELYGISDKGSLSRMTPSGDWSFDPPSAARWVFPQPNGSVIIAGNDGGQTQLWLIRPTDDEVVKTASIPLVSRGVRTQVGDRLYFTVDSGLIGVRTNDLSPVKSVRLSEPVSAIVPTPSGDRLYVALKNANSLAVIDRYSEAVSGRVTLPGPASELRMDPLGQFILARPDGSTDSAWVIAIGTNQLEGTIRSDWRADLPAFAPGSSIATARGNDVVIVNSRDLTDANTIAGGGRDFWYFFAWNGFRPRSADLDRPVTFDTPVAAPADSAVAPRDSAANPPLRDATPTMVEPPATFPPPRPAGYMVSFAAVLSEQNARQMAAEISVNGLRPRVIPTQSGSTTIYRVVLGPYGAREEAERVGRDSRRQYWVYEEAR
ncbi:MAG: SPOR domain-containing protein [Gemmatimonadales bacterium]